MTESYGLPPGTAINYKALGFPAWVDALCLKWGLDSSTYAGHQESDRPDIGAAPNPDHLNRGIDWAGDPQRMLDFAHWLVSVAPERKPGEYGPAGLEMVIHQSPVTGEQVWYPQWVDFSDDLPNHTDHVHTRHSASIDIAPPVSATFNMETNADQYALAIISEGQRRGITPRGIQIALATALVESNLQMYANSSVPESLNLPHDAVGADHDSVGLFQQRCPMWGPADVLMDPAKSAGLFYDHLVQLDYNGGDSPGSYAQAVQRSAFPDRYDGRFDEAVDLYNRLVIAPVPIPPPPTPQPPPRPGGIWMPDKTTDDLIREIHRGLFEPLPSKSRYGDTTTVWNVLQLIRNIDGFGFNRETQEDALLGDQWSQQAIENAAARGDQIAKAFYDRHAAGGSTPPPPQPTPQPQPTPTGRGGTISGKLAALDGRIQKLLDWIG